MNDLELKNYLSFTIKNDLQFRNRVLEIQNDKYKQIIKILVEYADGNWLYKNDYGEQYGEDKEHNDEEYVSEEENVNKLYFDIDNVEEKLLHIELEKKIKKHNLNIDKNILKV